MRGATVTENETEKKTPDPEGYNITAKILVATAPFGEWKVAQWSCPFCDTLYEFHGAGPDAFAVTISTKILKVLTAGLQFRDTCDCGAKHYVTRELVTVPGIKAAQEPGG
jgi:hypothetical protein